MWKKNLYGYETPFIFKFSKVGRYTNIGIPT